jgi:hypothetical protein
MRPRLEARHVVGRDLIGPGQAGLGIQTVHEPLHLGNGGGVDARDEAPRQRLGERIDDDPRGRGELRILARDRCGAPAAYFVSS